MIEESDQEQQNSNSNRKVQSPQTINIEMDKFKAVNKLKNDIEELTTSLKEKIKTENESKSDQKFDFNPMK
jgi:hypothetical protein